MRRCRSSCVARPSVDVARPRGPAACAPDRSCRSAAASALLREPEHDLRRRQPVALRDRAHAARSAPPCGSRSAARSPGRRCRARGTARAPRDPSRARRSSGSARTPARRARAATSSSSCRAVTLLTPSSRRRPASASASIARHASQSSAAEPVALRRAVQHEESMRVDAEVLERARERLRDLRRDRRVRVVRQAVVLPVAERELGLQEQLVARHRRRLAADRRADAGLVVVLALVRGVDAAEAGRRARRARALGRVLLPRGAVEEVGHCDPANGDRRHSRHSRGACLRSRRCSELR